MTPSPIGLPLQELDTPALLLDLDAFEHNVALMSERIRSRGKLWRPHAKAFKTPAIAHILRRAGAIGVTVAKVSEAEVMVAGGIEDVLIAHLVVGDSKLARLAALQRYADVKTTVDHPDHVEMLSKAAQAAGSTIGVLVDLDIGLGRTGVLDAKAALDLAVQVSRSKGLRFDGLMGYEGHALMIPDPAEKRLAISQSLGILDDARNLLEQRGFECKIVSAGGSGSYEYAADAPGPTELQAGGGIFACRYYTEGCGVKGHTPAISVWATVVSRPKATRAVLDVGFKSMSAHKQNPVLRDAPEAKILNLSAEHATVELNSWTTLKIGSKLHVIPGYSDLTFVLHDRVLGYRDGRVQTNWELWGRGKLQ